MQQYAAGFVRKLASLAIIVSCFALSAAAQGRFTPAIQVGDTIITDYELDQRIGFLTLLRAPGDIELLAREQLITAAIQKSAADAAGIELNQTAVEEGLIEFAGRADLTVEQFITALEQGGVEASTFREFVASSVLWGDYVRARFAEEARDLPLPLVARALTRTGTEGGVRVLFSEILLPAGSPETRNASLARAAELSNLETEEEFSAAARLFSVSGSRRSGGVLNWRALDALPEEIAGAVGNLSPGQISRPTEFDGLIGLFFLRDRENIPAGAPNTFNVDYALFFTEGSDADARKIIEEIDVCDDLYGTAKGLPEDRLIRDAAIFSALPADVQREVQILDVGDTAVLSRPSGAAVLMLCGRTIDSKSTIDLDLVGTRVLNQKIAALAAHHLSELRARTVITDFQN